jgi:hypothetical protein
MFSSKLVSSQPVTIISSRCDRRYIPHLAHFPSGLLRLNIGIGPDNSFTPGYAYHSYDHGKTWQEAPTPVPRIESCHVFSDGSYYEIDGYFFQDPDAPEYYIGNAGFSRDGRTFGKEYVRIHSPSCLPVTLRSMRQYGQPQEPWFDVINRANHNRPVSLDSVMVGGAHITSVIELDSPHHLLAVGYFRATLTTKKSVVMLFESTDGGRLWEEKSIAVMAEDKPEGANEAALVRLDSGELLVMARTGGLILQAWSGDLGATWSPPEPVRLVDEKVYITGVMPSIRKAKNGGLIAVFGRPKKFFNSISESEEYDYVAESYGQCGKFVMIDPGGTGRQWQGLIDLHPREVAYQELMGVPPEKRLRVQEDKNVRDSNSWEYLTINEVNDDEFLVTYDVQHYYEHWNAHPVYGVRMVKVRWER